MFLVLAGNGIRHRGKPDRPSKAGSEERLGLPPCAAPPNVERYGIGELRAGFTDLLRRDDADRFRAVDHGARGRSRPITLDADAVAGFRMSGPNALSRCRHRNSRSRQPGLVDIVLAGTTSAHRRHLMSSAVDADEQALPERDSQHRGALHYGEDVVLPLLVSISHDGVMLLAEIDDI